MRLLETVQARTRSLLRAPAFLTTSVLTLGLGIGLTTAVFTVADALLLRKLPMHDQNRLVALWGEKRDGTAAHRPHGIADAHEFIRRTRTLREAALVDFYGATSVPVVVAGGKTIIPLRGAPVSGPREGLRRRVTLGDRRRAHRRPSVTSLPVHSAF